MVALAYMALIVTAVALVMWYTAVDALGGDVAGLLSESCP